jgi:DeoR family myo-inositol catabolism operon transcriptional repressor
MDKFLRKEEIFGFIKGNRICAVDELQRKYAVSLSTLHRDLNELLREGRITKFYGKVAVTEERNLFNARRNVNVELKKRIAQKALEYIREGDCLFFDNSTTVYYLAEQLSLSPLKNVVVVSNSAFISDLFLANKNVDFVSTGGKLNKELNCYVGTHALHVIDDFNASKYFFSCSGFSVEGGISDIYIPDEQAIKNRMREKSGESFLLVDSTKIGRTSVIKWFEPNAVDHVITDKTIDEEILNSITQGMTSLIVA